MRPAVELFEWNQYPAGMKSLRSLLKHKDKEVADSAAKLMEAVKAEAAEWMGDAEAAKDAEPVKAYDLYSKVVAAFGPADELAKTAAEALKAAEGERGGEEGAGRPQGVRQGDER